MERVKTLLWVMKLQFNSARLAFVLNSIYYLYDGLVSIVFAYISAKLITSVTEVALQGAEPNSVYIWFISLFGLSILTNILGSINRVVESRIEQKVEITTSEIYFKKMYSLSQEQFDDETFNVKLARGREGLMDLNRVTRELNWTMSSFVRFISAIIAITVVAPILGLIVTIVAIPVAAVGIKQNKIREKMYKDTESIDRISYRSRWLLVDPNSMPEVRLVNGFKSLVNSWKTNTVKTNDMYFETDKKLFKYDFVEDVAQPIIEVLANVYFFRLLLVGTIGLDRFIFLRGVLEQAGSSAISLANSVNRLHEMSINLGNFEEIYNTKPTIPDGKIIADAPLTIEFKNVSFTYPGTTESVLDNISMIIVPGSKLALVGENGAGKSTLIKLLLRQYLPTGGHILVNGTDIRDIKTESYYNALSILSQNFMTVQHLTIKENLLFGLNSNKADKEIYDALELVDAQKFVAKLPNKLNQRLDNSFDDGTDLSGGQIQRLGVARALLRKGDLMILDEPTSAIDAKGEFSIFNNIYKEHAGRTTLIVSHRFSTVRKADMIVVMNNKTIEEYGSHEDLMKYGGLYKEMFELQAEGYK
jgi:ATP-binding cassette, subfamily B, bacterial